MEVGQRAFQELHQMRNQISYCKDGLKEMRSFTQEMTQKMLKIQDIIVKEVCKIPKILEYNSIIWWEREYDQRVLDYMICKIV